MKKGLSLLLAFLMVLSVFTPAISPFEIKAEATTSAASDAYATVITASDFQDGRSGNAYEEAFSTLMQKAKANGVDEPDGFILGGDYESSNAGDHDTPIAYRRVESVITNAYPHFNRKNIVGIQGNHDVNDPTVIDQTGPHEFDDYIVYVINNSDYPAGTGGTSAYNKTVDTNNNLVAYFNKLKAEGETRPIFIATHIPLHHNSRNPKANNKDADGNVVSTGWNETLYGKVLFDTINENAKIFDIVFLFGHNHSGDYDDYIGGSVNYFAKGDKIRIADYTQVPGEESYTEETLNFTYMNYGYVGYTNNTNETTLTINSFEICPDRIVASRYSTAGKYGEEKVIDRNMKTDEPSVFVDAYNTATVGSATGVAAIASGLEDPVFTWTSSNERVAEINGSDRVAKITYKATGTTTITVKATERSNSYKTATYRYDVTVSEDTGSTPGAAIYRAKEQVDNRTLEYYQINFGETVALSGSYYGLTENASTSWTSSNNGVAKVNQYGLVTFVGAGTTYITYEATDNGVIYSAQVKLVVSTEKKVEYKYVQTKTITAGKSYVIASEYNNVKAIYSDRTATHDNVIALSGSPTAFEGFAGSYYILLDDQSFVWNAVETANSNQVYLQNADSGLYLAAYATGTNDVGTSVNLGYFELTKVKPSNGVWQYSNNILQTTDGLRWYTRSNGVANIISGSGRETIIFEQVPLDAYANIEFTGEVVNDKTKTVYLAVNGRQITLDGDYANIQQLKSEAWTSSNTNVATINSDGVVTFKGVQGETVITYTATDAVNNKTVAASFTISAVITAEPTRLFKYTETIEQGKNYVIANKIDNGSYGTVFSSYKVSSTKLLADRVDITVEDGASYIEIPQHLTEVVWTPETAGGSAFYIKNEANGEYLYANSDGTYDDWNSLIGNVYTSSSYATNTEQYIWTYVNGSQLYNNFAYEDTQLGAQSHTYVRSRSAEFLGVGTANESNVYFYEEIASKPKAIITSQYEVLGEKVERTEICPYQTETFVPVAESFPKNDQVNFVWSSSNTSVATIDENGVITYTGKEGEVTITLTATSKVADSTGAYPADTATVTIDVIGGVGYVDPFPTVYTENAFYKTTRLVPGRRYVMHTSYSDAPNLAISNQNKSGYVRLLCETIDAPQTDENGEYVVTTNNNFIWECIDSDISGYYLLKNVGNGQYFFTSESESTTAKRQAGTTVNSAHPEADSVTNAADTLLIRYDQSTGMLHSKQVDDTGSVYGVGNVAKSTSGGYYYIRPTYDGGSPINAITLYEEPVAGADEPELPDGDVYLLTDKLEPGKKYIVSNSNVEGSSYITASTLYTDGATPRAVTTTVQTLDGKVFIANPQNALVLTCEESEKEGYYYLKDEAGKYFTSYFYRFTNADGVRETNENAVRLTGLDEGYERIYKQLKYENSYLQNSGETTTAADGSVTITKSYPYFYTSTSNPRMAATYYGDSANKVYLFALEEKSETPEESEIPEVVTEIRKQDGLESVDITRVMQYRYDVKNGDTEQILRYIRGVASGYTVKWSVSDTTIATIDEDTGLLTYTGKTGYVDVRLTIIGEDFDGKDITRTLKTTFNISADQNKSKIAVPETVYMAPANGASTVGQVYVNNVMDPGNNYEIETVAARVDDMYFGLHIPNAESFKLKISNVTNSANGVEIYNLSNGAVLTEADIGYFDSTGTVSSDGAFGLKFNGVGLQPGEKATVKWDIIVTMDGGREVTYTAYTVMYAPERTVGAVAEARQVDNSQNEVSSWITGANGVDHSKWSPLASFHADKSAIGYFKEDPLYNQNPPTNSTGETATDLINVVQEYPAENTYYENAYVMQSATNGNDDSTAKSYLGLLTVDKSRYTNTNQIPNLKIGFDALRRGDWKKDSFHTYANYYTLGTADAFTSTDFSAVPGSDWTQERYFTNFAENHSLPDRYTLIPSYSVSDIDGKYIHVLNKGQAIQDFWAYVEREYSTAATSVLCSVTDKSTLREMVVSAYKITEEVETFSDALKNAATVLGDPAATQPEIDKASDDLYDAMADKADTYYALKYDNLFSAFEYSQYLASMTMSHTNASVSYANGVITTTNTSLGTYIDANTEEEKPYTEAYTNYGSADGYYHVDLKPNTEYVFEYDVTTTLAAQVFMFFYNSTGGAGDVPSNMSVKVNNGNWGSKSEGSPWWGNYTHGAGTYHYAIKFTTGANTVKAGFRFGNTSNDPVTSTFSNIKLVDSAHYYEDALYSKTESTHKEYTTYGSLITPVRPGYSFIGWKDINGSTVTGFNNATEHLTIYSQWKEVQYKVKFNGNGGAGSTTSATLTLNQPAVLPGDFARDNHTFLGWSFDDDAKVADFKADQTITVEDAFDYIDSNNQVTLYAVWERNYSVYYSANGGEGTVNHTYNTRSQAHILPDDSTISRDGYEFLGWALTSDATAPDYYPGDEFYVGNIDSQYVNETKQEVILHAVWRANARPSVTFDNLIDMPSWEKLTPSNAVASDFTGKGFTLTSDVGVGEGTFSSPYFDVTPGKQYKIDMDFEGDGWDVYIFFCDANGNWIDFTDGGNRYSSNGGGNQTRVFTAPDKQEVVKAQIRVDANNSANTVKFSNIRVYEVGTVEEGVSYETAKTVTYGNAYGELPVPTRYGYDFLGWVNAAGETVTAETIMNSEKVVNLFSNWKIKDPQLAADTVVIDFGLPVKIDVLINDINMSGGTLTAVGTGVQGGTVLNTGAYGSSRLTGKADTLTLANGTATISEGKIVYRPNSTNYTNEIVFYYEYQRANGDFYYTTVTVIPAASIYFEETMFTFENSTVEKKGVTYNYNWVDVGTPVGERFQAEDRPGTFTFAVADADNVYGTDSAYADSTTYSMGSAKYVSVDINSVGKAPKAKFAFTGTGIDLFSVTDNTAGLLTISLYQGGTKVKGYMVSTYHGYAYDSSLNDGEGGYVPANSGAIFQVPAFRIRDLAYGTYDVVVEPMYSSAFDVTKAGKYGVYVDSVRIFEPMGSDNDVANDAYLADGEYGTEYLELRDTIIKKDANGDFIVNTHENSSLYFDGINPDATDKITDYVKNGPKNEVYLDKGQAIAFDISASSNLSLASLQIGMKLIGNNGNAKVTVMNATQQSKSSVITLTSATEQFYKLDSVVEWNQAKLGEGVYETAAPIVVMNNSDTEVVISLTSLKWGFKDNAAASFIIFANENTAPLAYAAMARAAEPQEPEFDPVAKENITVSAPAEFDIQDGKGEFTITTSTEVTRVTVDGVDLTDYETDEDGNKVWKHTFEPETEGDIYFDVKAYDEQDNESETIIVSATVTNSAPEIDDDNTDVEKPEDDEVEDDKQDFDSLINGSINNGSFGYRIVQLIFALLGKILSLFGGVTV